MKKRIRPDNSTKVWRYIMKKGEVSKTQLQRDFSHRLTALELDEILLQLWDARVIDERFEWTRAQSKQPRVFYFSLAPWAFEGDKLEKIKIVYAERKAKQTIDPRFVLEAPASGPLTETIKEALD